jgi:hypothetical protein
MKLVAVDQAAQQQEDATILYRYISIDKLKYFFEGSFSLNRVSAWPDRMECADFEFLQQIPRFNEQRLVSDFFASCWTTDQLLKNSLAPGYSVQLANDELKEDGSASMWEGYCQPGGVRVATTLGKLRSRFESATPVDATVYYGKVNYRAVRDNFGINKLIRIEETLFHKRIGFQHEAEFRFVGNFANCDTDYVAVPIPNYYDFLDEILVFPVKNAEQVGPAKELHNLGTGLTTNSKGTNYKNGSPFCRVSQLYGSVSSENGNVHCLDRA